MVKYFVIRNIRGNLHVHLSKFWRGTCLSVEMLSGYMLICWKLKGYMVRERLGTHVL